MQIPFHRPDIPPNINEIISDSIRSGWLTTGSQVKEFEGKLREYLNTKHVVAVNSCTAALHLALLAKGFRKGDKFIAPTYTFVSSIECGEYIGMEPILVDCEKNGFAIDLNQVEDHLKKDEKVKAIIPVHFAGRPIDMKRVFEIADRYGLFVLEDAAHALETKSNFGKVGNTSHGAAFSFYANKNLTTFGEGGAFATNDENIAAKVKRLSLHGINKDGWARYGTGGQWEYDVSELGFKYNLSDISASFGLWQMKHLDRWQNRRREIVKTYKSGLKNLHGLILPDMTRNDGNAWHLFVIKIRADYWKISRNELIEKINELGIGISVHYRPIHLFSYYQRKYEYNSDNFPNANSLFESVITLPLYPSLKEEEVDYIINSISFLSENYLK